MIAPTLPPEGWRFEADLSSPAFNKPWKGLPTSGQYPDITRDPPTRVEQLLPVARDLRIFEIEPGLGEIGDLDRIGSLPILRGPRHSIKGLFPMFASA